MWHRLQKAATKRFCGMTAFRMLDMLDMIPRDLFYALRTLRTSKEWSAAAVLSLALGIGSSAVLFSVFQNYALEQLPVHNPEELVTMRWSGEQLIRRASYHYAHIAEADGASGGHTFPFEVVEQLLSARRTLADAITFAPTGAMNAFANGRAEFVNGQFVSGNFYSSLGVEAVEGRVILPYDDIESAAPVVVISQQYRARRFGMDEPVVGETLTINGMPFTVAGVSPAGFRDLIVRGLPDAPDVTIPLALEPRLRGSGSLLRSPSTWWLSVMGRMRPGVRKESVETELGLVFQQAVRASAETQMGELHSPLRLPRLLVVPGGHGVSDPSRDVVSRLAILAGMLGSVLVIVCVNVAGLLFSRGTVRRREIVVRAAVGASRGRLIVQLLTESVVLAGAGGTVGLVAAIWSAPWLSTVVLPRLPADITIVSGPVLLFATALTVAGGILFGVVPAIYTTRPALAPLARRGPWDVLQPTHSAGSLANGGPDRSDGLSPGGGRSLLADTLESSTDRSRIQPRQRRDIALQPSLSGYSRERAILLYRDLEDQLLTIPGIHSVSSSAVGGTLLDGGGVRVGIQLRNRTDNPEASMLSVDPDFFDTLQIPLVLGRMFSSDDTLTSQPVALVNQAFAREFFPDGGTIGKRFRGGPNEVEVVGGRRRCQGQQLARPRAADVLLASDAAFAAGAKRRDPNGRVSSIRHSDYRSCIASS